MTTRFLSARWQYLVMLNYEIDPAVLASYVPPGVELDTWQGHTFASMVGFMFLKTRVLGVPIPFHRNFEEVNLRFYVGRQAAEGWRRGVVFIKEIVPRPAIAAVARWVYGENYVALRMRHHLELAAPTPRPVAYEWRHHGTWQRLAAQPTGEPSLPQPGSEEEFITEHYWGYTRRRSGGALEYRVEHPPWRVWHTSAAELHCDVTTLYGPQFAAALSATPTSAFIAEGSPVSVYAGARLA